MADDWNPPDYEDVPELDVADVDRLHATLDELSERSVLGDAGACALFPSGFDELAPFARRFTALPDASTTSTLPCTGAVQHSFVPFDATTCCSPAQLVARTVM